LDYSAIRTDAYALNGYARHYLHCASLTLDSSHLIGLWSGSENLRHQQSRGAVESQLKLSEYRAKIGGRLSGGTRVEKVRNSRSSIAWWACACLAG
jgi:hypothetical protein